MVRSRTTNSSATNKTLAEAEVEYASTWKSFSVRLMRPGNKMRSNAMKRLSSYIVLGSERAVGSNLYGRNLAIDPLESGIDKSITRVFGHSGGQGGCYKTAAEEANRPTESGAIHQN
jgi:hypothetical protein